MMKSICHMLIFILMSCSLMPFKMNNVIAQTSAVSTVSQLKSALSAFNAIPDGGPAEIIIADGTYDISTSYPEYLRVDRHQLTIRSQSGNREAVILEGDAMSASAVTPVIFIVYASHFTVRDLTMQKVATHCIQIVGHNDADYITISNCVIRDAYEQIVKTATDFGPISADYGVMVDCLLEYTAGVGPNDYIGGIDCHNAHNWLVKGNTFRNIISPHTDIAEHAIHFWSGSSNTISEQNLIINCDRGIGYGLGGVPHYGGIIRNNMIYHDASNPYGFADVGIGVESCPNVQIYNNTIYFEHSYANAVEYRFSSTTNVLIYNNLANKLIRSRDGGVAIVSNNIQTALRNWFLNVSNANLRLNAYVGQVVDQGLAVTGLSDDFDGEVRPQLGGIDIGADELTLPLVVSVSNSNSAVYVDVTSISDAVYKVEYSTNLTIGTWSSVEHSVTGSGELVTFSLPSVSSNTAHYRLKWMARP